MPEIIYQIRNYKKYNEPQKDRKTGGKQQPKQIRGETFSYKRVED